MGVSADQLTATQVPAEQFAPLLTSAVVLVVCVDLAVVAALDQELDRVGVIAGASVYPFAWNVLLAARTGQLRRSPHDDGGGRGAAAIMPLGKPAPDRQADPQTRPGVCYS